MDPTDSLPALASQRSFTESFFIRNVEALSAAAQATANGTLLFTQQQTALLRSMVEQSAKSCVEVMSERDPKQFVTKAFDAARAWMQSATAVSNMLSELSARNTAEAAKIIQDRAYAAFGEMQSFTTTLVESQQRVTTIH